MWCFCTILHHHKSKSLFPLSECAWIWSRSKNDFKETQKCAKWKQIKLGFLCRGSCHLQTVRVLLLLFQFGFLLFIYLFSALIAVAKTSKTMLNSSGESGHTCLVPEKIEREIKKTISFTIATERIKYLGIHLPK